MLAALTESALRSFVLGGFVWIGLKLFRLQNPRVHMAAWVLVLLASLSMPLLMHWMTLTITVETVQATSPESIGLTNTPLPAQPDVLLPSEPSIRVTTNKESEPAINWYSLASVIYGLVSAVLLMRLATGIYLTWRMVRAATPLHHPWAAGSDVRVSHSVGGPVTYGSTILFPPEWIEWDAPKRQAVLAHEGTHVANLDFYVLLLASFNRAVFWFSPFAWWQLSRLVELAEVISDAHALEVVGDRLSYAEILLDLMGGIRRMPAGLEMARASTIRTRIERILSATTIPAKIGWRSRFLITFAILPAAVVSAGTITRDVRPAVEYAGLATDDGASVLRASQHISFYSLSETSIFTIFEEGGNLFGQLTGHRRLRLSQNGDGTYVYPAAGDPITLAAGAERQPDELGMNLHGHDLRAVRIVEASAQQTEPASSLDSYAGWYELNPFRVLAVTQDQGRLFVQETGQPKHAVVARGADAFGDDDNLVIFLRDDQAKVTRVLIQEPVYGAGVATRIDIARAKTIEERFARRIAEVPDRFRVQTPARGGKEELLRLVADVQRGAPDYDRMTAALSAKIRRQISELQPIFTRLGAVKSIFFRGVGGGGYDFYGVKFANGTAELRLLLDSDGKIDDVLFRADGNERSGEVVACSNEKGLRSQADAIPIHVTFYNVAGADIRLYRLDAEGKRTIQGALGENMSSSVLTGVDSPWVVADASGTCLEIVLPGQRTRFVTVEEARPDGLSEHTASRRTAPLDGSEDMLRQYIEALERGEPNYDHMTAEVAAHTRRQLAFYQAILRELGTLRALSFRGVTSMGNDIYMAHFANGVAEWRIGLVKDGSIGRIALGPQ